MYTQLIKNTKNKNNSLVCRGISMFTLDPQHYGRNFALLHHSRVCLTFTILIQICFLSYVTHRCHFAISIHDPLIHNSFKPYLHDLHFMTLMLLQVKPSPKLFIRLARPSLPPISLCQVPTHNHNKNPTINKNLKWYASLKP